jgi:hypothetical protein
VIGIVGPSLENVLRFPRRSSVSRPPTAQSGTNDQSGRRQGECWCNVKEEMGVADSGGALAGLVMTVRDGTVAH